MGGSALRTRIKGEVLAGQWAVCPQSQGTAPLREAQESSGNSCLRRPSTMRTHPAGGGTRGHRANWGALGARWRAAAVRSILESSFCKAAEAPCSHHTISCQRATDSAVRGSGPRQPSRHHHVTWGRLEQSGRMGGSPPAAPAGATAMQGPGPGPGLSCLTSRGCCAGSGHQGMRGWGPVSAAGDTWGPGAQEAGPEHPEVTCIGDRGQQNAPHLPNPRDDGPSHFLGAQGQREVKHSCWLPGPPPPRITLGGAVGRMARKAQRRPCPQPAHLSCIQWCRPARG